MTSPEESLFSGLFICQYNYEDDSVLYSIAYRTFTYTV